MKSILFVNGSLFGQDSNTFSLVEKLCKFFPAEYKVDVLELSKLHTYTNDDLVKIIGKHDGFIFGTGTYWQSWSSFMQQFFERMVDYEGHSMWMGKPAACVVTMHSVGGMDVLSRLQSNLGMFGLLIPPMSNIVHSYVNTIARQAGNDDGDIWDERYLVFIAENLMAAIEHKPYKSWDVETLDPHIKWCK
jgi:multimeric flavodoxin WrbA